VARQLISGGTCECALACGFEQMKPGSLESAFNDRTNPMDNHFKVMLELRGFGVSFIISFYHLRSFEII
jgi:hypothetical protein